MVEEICQLFAEGLMEAGENFSNAEIKENTTENGGEKFDLRSDFSREFDNWDRKNDKKIFSIGVTSKALQSIGISKKKITWDGKKILKIMSKHSEMTADIIKQVPKIIEEPIIVMQSKNTNSRITLFGEVYSNGNPILAVLELSPKNKRGYDLGEIKIASAYAKDKAQNLINSSNILYIENNKKRINTFSTLTGLQLPVGGVNSTNIIPTSIENVNSKNKESARDSDGNTLSEQQQEFFKDSKVRDDETLIFKKLRYNLPLSILCKSMSKYSFLHKMITEYPKGFPMCLAHHQKQRRFDMNYSPNMQRNNAPNMSMREFPASKSAFPLNPVVAMAYVPFQTDNATYDEFNALACGTLFPCLSKPFKGSGSR